MVKKTILFSFFFLLGFAILGQKPQKIKKYYPNGTLMEKGKAAGEIKTGIWIYYHEAGWLERKEKWKNGKMQWTLLYNEKHQKVKWIHSDGTERLYKGCNCKN